MKKEIIIGFALVAIVAMLFAGIAAAAASLDGSAASDGAASAAGTTDSDGAASTTGTTDSDDARSAAGTTGSDGAASAQDEASKHSAGSAGTAGSTTAAGSAGTAGSTTTAGSAGTAGSTTTAGSAGTAGSTTAAITRVIPTGKENVQITNLGASDVNLAGFTVTTQDGTEFTLSSTQLKSGDDVTIFFGVGTNSKGVSYLNGKNDDYLNDISGAVTLANNNGEKVSTLSYDNTYTSNGSGTTTSAAGTPSVPTTAGTASASR